MLGPAGWDGRSSLTSHTRSEITTRGANRWRFAIWRLAHEHRHDGLGQAPGEPSIPQTDLGCRVRSRALAGTGVHPRALRAIAAGSIQAGVPRVRVGHHPAARLHGRAHTLCPARSEDRNGWGALSALLIRGVGSLVVLLGRRLERLDEHRR